MSKRSVGIDLGTSHTVVAYVDPSSGEVRTFPIDQRVTRSERAAADLLPSCLYAPLEGEVSPAPDEPVDWIPGELAKRRGAEVPARLIASAKSWLCHPRVDRRSPILPWSTDDDGEGLGKLSPVEAATRVLSHVRHAWDTTFPSEPLAEQDVVLTVPASFDEVARELTLEAAQAAGLSPRLCEEPQAAFYDYLGRHGETALRALFAGGEASALVLVCDVGGGTTDLSLLEIKPGDASGVAISRVAVGPHLLLGGDNMDLALAHLAESRLVTAPERLPSRRFAELTLACRGAKERLLGPDPPQSVPVTLLGGGAQLIGGALRTELSAEDAARVVLEGFFPIVSRDARPEHRRGGLVAFGLPYERDVAITRHIAQFFARHAPGHPAPAAVLLNGGVFRASALVARVADALASWDGASAPRVLPFDDPDLAVARGAALYARTLRGEGKRIESSAARGYYVGVSSAAGTAPQAMCVVPRGAKEGVVQVAASRPVGLLVGRAARFDLFTSDEPFEHAAGDVVTLDPERFEPLPPIATKLFNKGSGRADEREITVVLEGELTAVGTLELACVEQHPAEGQAPRRLRLAFQLRAEGEESPRSATSTRPPPSVAPRGQLAQALALLDRAFGRGKPPAEPREIKTLGRDLEKLLGERMTWTTATARALADPLVAETRGRKRTLDHERVYWQLLGFCMRPGFGHALDEDRMRAISPLFAERLAFSKEVRSWQQFWIAWRRMAGGLDEAMQTRMRDELDPFLAPAEKKLKKPKGARPESPDDLLDLVSTLERVPAARRGELGAWLIERTWTERDPRIWMAIGRLGARIPTYASVHHVVAPSLAERWLDHLLREKWAALPTAPRAARDLARMTGDRARDVSEKTRAVVAKRLEEAGAPSDWARSVREVVEREAEERSEFFGEGLPVGLRLLGEGTG